MAIQPQFVEQLFEAALALEPARREALLDQVGSRDPKLRRTVEELLAEDANAGSLLKVPESEHKHEYPNQSCHHNGKTGRSRSRPNPG